MTKATASLVKDAIKDTPWAKCFQCVEDGQELMDYLKRQGKYADPAVFPWPDLILLDLNMPRKDGRETLKELKCSPALRSIPVVVLTTSSAEEDILQCYGEGANSFVSKSSAYSELEKVMKTIGRYWFEVASLPCKESR